MRHLKPADYRRMPWKNGGGTTTEIAVEPGASGAQRFVWRVSIADVEADGPFSLFPGYDRHILLLEGNGMQLGAGANGVVDLTQRLQPRSFSGDWAVDGRLVDGPVRDFNVIVDRSCARADIEMLGPPSFTRDLSADLNETLLIYAGIGEAKVSSRGAPAFGLAAGETIIPQGEDAPLSIQSKDPVATLVLVRIELLRQAQGAD